MRKLLHLKEWILIITKTLFLNSLKILLKKCKFRDLVTFCKQSEKKNNQPICSRDLKAFCAAVYENRKIYLFVQDLVTFREMYTYFNHLVGL